MQDDSKIVSFTRTRQTDARRKVIIPLEQHVTVLRFSRDHNLPLGLALRSRRNKVNVRTLLFSATVPDESKTQLKIETESECFAKS